MMERCFGLPEAERVCSDMRWRRGGQRLTIDTNTWDEKDINKFLKFCETENRAIYNKLSTWLTLKKDPEGAKVKNLQHLAVALKGYIEETKHKFVFTENTDGVIVPWLVTKIEYQPAVTYRGSYEPPYTEMDLEAIYRNELKERTVLWYGEDMLHAKKYISDMMAAKEVFRETEEAFNNWEAQLPDFYAVSRMLGEQFLCTGSGFEGDSGDEDDRWSWWRSSGIEALSLTREGIPTRCVIDDNGDPNAKRDRHKEKKSISSNRLLGMWGPNKLLGADQIKAEGEHVYMRPVHPYVLAFNFDLNCWIEVHVKNLKPYVYNTKLGEKLILPAGVKQLVDVLITGASHAQEDIVQGKVGGVIVIATGFPGTGKTLTAEVYSEQAEKPLYPVQCSQLGTDEVELEKRLGRILARATRWGCILLIDEADVYVRARGDDLQQNAIVGVFLRSLERFRGVMFMTSNRADAIDDAIMSRAIAHIKYDLPTQSDLVLIWEVLSENYKIDLVPTEFKVLANEFPGISGRNVKTLIKLATAVARKGTYKRGEAIELIRQVAPFVDFPKGSGARDRLSKKL